MKLSKIQQRYRLAIAIGGLLPAALVSCGALGDEQLTPEPISAVPAVDEGPDQATRVPRSPIKLPATFATLAPEYPNAICVDGNLSGNPFQNATCTKTVKTLSEAVEDVGPGSVILVRAFESNDPNSIRGMGTYRDLGLQNRTLDGTIDNPIIIQAEEFDPEGDFAKPIVDGGVRVSGTWIRAPQTEATWQVPFAQMPAGFTHWACVDRIWVSREAGTTELADFPLTRPIQNQGNSAPYYSDCENNTNKGRRLTPAEVDGFPGSYLWLDGVLYIHLPGGEDPNLYTVEVPRNHPFSAYESAAGLIIRGFAVYHSVNGIDLFSCGIEASNRCEASHNTTSFNYPFGLQPGPYSYLHHNSGTLNTIQLIKITSDFSEVSFNEAGPQLSHGFKLFKVRACNVHNNKVFGNDFFVPEMGTQSGWTIIGTRDVKAGILIMEGTQECTLAANEVFNNTNGFYVRSNADDATWGNIIEANSITENATAMRWRDPLIWERNFSNGNSFSVDSVFRWGNETGTFADYVEATGLDADSRLIGNHGSGDQSLSKLFLSRPLRADYPLH